MRIGGLDHENADLFDGFVADNLIAIERGRCVGKRGGVSAGAELERRGDALAGEDAVDNRFIAVRQRSFGEAPRAALRRFSREADLRVDIVDGAAGTDACDGQA